MGEAALRIERVANAPVGPFSLVEVLPVAVLVPIAVWDTVLGHAERVSGPPWMAAVLLSAASALLLWRRRRPLLVLTLIVALELVQLALLGPTQSLSGPLCVAIAVFACGAHGRRPAAYLGIVIGVAAVLIGTWAEDPAAFAGSWGWSLNVLWIFGLGALVRWQILLAGRAREAEKARAAAASAEQRLALSRDLHDVLAHSLAVMIVQAEAADELVDTDPARAHGALARVQATGRSALADIRGLVGALRTDGDPAASTGGLEGLAGLVDSVRGSGLPVELRVHGDLEQVPVATGQVIYRVVQEALTNALRHAGPVSTVVTVDIEPAAGVRVRVNNSGASSSVPVGAGPAGQTSSVGGHGLTGMRERVLASGGTLEAGPADDGGFTVTATLPLRRSRS